MHSKYKRLFLICEKLDAEEGLVENSISEPLTLGEALRNVYPRLIEQSARKYFGNGDPTGKHLNWGAVENVIGKQFFTPGVNERLIAVVKDFNFVSLKEMFGPFVLDISDKKRNYFEQGL